MKTHEEAIRSIVDLEKQLDLYRYKVWGIPLWNVIRYKTRRQYLYKETGIDERATAKSPKNIKGIIKYSCLSLKQFIHFTTKKHFIDNLIIGFSRLEKVGDFYIDKFVDPHKQIYRIITSISNTEKQVVTNFPDVIKRIYSILIFSIFHSIF